MSIETRSDEQAPERPERSGGSLGHAPRRGFGPDRWSWRWLRRRATWFWTGWLITPGAIGWAIGAALIDYPPDWQALVWGFVPLLAIPIFILWGWLIERFAPPPPLARKLLLFLCATYTVVPLVGSILTLGWGLIHLDFDEEDWVIGALAEIVMGFVAPTAVGVVMLAGIWKVWRRRNRAILHEIGAEDGLEQTGKARRTPGRLIAKLDGVTPIWAFPSLLFFQVPPWLFMLIVFDELDDLLEEPGFWAWVVGIWMALTVWGLLVQLFAKRPRGVMMLLILGAFGLGVAQTTNVLVALAFGWTDGWDVLIPALISVGLLALAVAVLVTMSVWLIIHSIVAYSRGGRRPITYG